MTARNEEEPMNSKIIMLNTGEYEAQAEHSWLISSGFSVFSSNNKSRFADHIQNITPEFIFINAVNSIKEGIEACIHIKSKIKYTPITIIFYSEWPDDQTQINILKAGPDECLIKTTNQALFGEKLKNISGKHTFSLTSKNNYIEEEVIKIDRDQFCIYVNGTKYYLPRLQFNLLELLMSQPKKIFTYKEIENQVFGKPTRIKTLRFMFQKLRE